MIRSPTSGRVPSLITASLLLVGDFECGQLPQFGVYLYARNEVTWLANFFDYWRCKYQRESVFQSGEIVIQ